MRVALQTWGTEGDIRPFRILAAALASRGHDVTLAITQLSRSDPTRDNDVGYRTLHAGGAGSEGLDTTELRERVGRHRLSLTRMGVVLDEILRSHLSEMDDAARELADHNDVMVRHPVAYPAALAAFSRNKPSVVVQLAPAPRLGQVPSKRPFGDVVNRMRRHGHLVGLGVEELLGVRHYRELTGRTPQLRGQELLVGGDRRVIAASPAIVEPAGADARVEIIGQIHDDPRVDELADDVEEFLRAGDPPLLVTPGHLATMTGTDTTFVAWIAEAADRARVRTLLQIPRHLVPDGLEGQQLLRVDFVPHAAVMVRCAAVMHHGGAGTVHAVARAGLPAVVMPHAFDQYYWADRLAHLGVAVTEPPDRRDPASLTRKIRTAVHDPALRTAAETLSHAVSRDRGLETAVAVVESLGRT